tara:strand:+ start:104 stop:658 length:555 start_codon:yes stop_codon:yes gene_type:complete
MEEKQFEERPLGFLGNLFIEERMRYSTFDQAFDDWKSFERTMEFLLRYPMVADYNRYDEHRKERRKELRQLAKAWFGDHIKSADVESLAWIYGALRCFGVMPEKRREFSASEFIAILAQSPEVDGDGIQTLDDESTNILASEFSEFIDEHDLSHVPEPTMGTLFFRHAIATVEEYRMNKPNEEE